MPLAVFNGTRFLFSTASTVALSAAWSSHLEENAAAFREGGVVYMCDCHNAAKPPAFHVLPKYRLRPTAGSSLRSS